MKWAVLISLTALVLCSCSDQSDSETTPVEYRLTVGDTTIIIPEAAVRFAGARGSLGNFVWDAYMLREYQVARDPAWNHPGAIYSGTLISWKVLGWSARQTFLVPPYVHDVMTADPAQYYYDIGTYLGQFGYGWRDTFDPQAEFTDPSWHIWLHPADSTLVPDSTHTVQFDGTSHLIEQYRAMWTIQF